jgi:riboflavin biosynthesis pyrimidine reductase
VADSPAITCRWAPGPETMATVKILVDSRLLSDGALRSAIHVHVGKPVRETVTIPVEVVGGAE